MNNVILRGRLTADAEIKITADEKSTTIARFSLAETIGQYTAKGSEVLITGRLHTYFYSKDD